MKEKLNKMTKIYSETANNIKLLLSNENMSPDSPKFDLILSMNNLQLHQITLLTEIIEGLLQNDVLVSYSGESKDFVDYLLKDDQYDPEELDSVLKDSLNNKEKKLVN